MKETVNYPLHRAFRDILSTIPSSYIGSDRHVVGSTIRDSVFFVSLRKTLWKKWNFLLNELRNNIFNRQTHTRTQIN